MNIPGPGNQGEGGFEQEQPLQPIVTEQPPIAGQIIIDSKGTVRDVPALSDNERNEGVKPTIEVIPSNEIIDPNKEYLTSEQARFKETKESMDSFPKWLGSANTAAEAVNLIYDSFTNPDNPDFTEEDLLVIEKLLKDSELSEDKKLIANVEEIKGAIQEKLDKIGAEIQENLDNLKGDPNIPDSGDIPDELLKKEEGKLKQFFNMALLSGAEWAGEGAKTTSFSEVMSLLLDCGFAGGLYRGGNLKNLEGGLEKGSDDVKLIGKIKGSPEDFIKLIDTTFGNNGEHIDHPDLNKESSSTEFKKAVEFFNEQASDEDKWINMQKGISYFMTNGSSTDLKFSDDIRRIFIRLQSDKEITSFLNLDKEEKNSKVVPPVQPSPQQQVVA